MFKKLNPFYIYKNHTRIIPYIKKYILIKPLYKFRFFLARIGLVFTPNERKVKNLQNKHKGKRAFVLGNGPSLNLHDIEMLKNEVTFAANKIYLMYESTNWRPTYYCVEDDLVMKQNFWEINSITDSIKLFPADMLAYAPKVKGGVYFSFVHQDLNYVYPTVSDDAMQGVYWGSTIVYSMVQLALHMGASEVYILGVDFSFDVPKNHDSLKKEIVSEGEVNHFHKDYRKPGEKWNLPNIEIQKKAFTSLKKFSNIGSVKIYNITRGGKLEILERKNLEDLFV